MTTLTEYFGPVISTYTRVQAIADGVLVDVTNYAKEFGFRYPVAVTRNVWDTCVDWDNQQESVYQHEYGRLYDLLELAAQAARTSKSNLIYFEVERIPKGQTGPYTVKLKSHCGPGDTAESVITIMLPWED